MSQDSGSADHVADHVPHSLGFSQPLSQTLQALHELSSRGLLPTQSQQSQALHLIALQQAQDHLDHLDSFTVPTADAPARGDPDSLSLSPPELPGWPSGGHSPRRRPPSAASQDHADVVMEEGATQTASGDEGDDGLSMIGWEEDQEWFVYGSEEDPDPWSPTDLLYASPPRDDGEPHTPAAPKKKARGLKRTRRDSEIRQTINFQDDNDDSQPG